MKMYIKMKILDGLQKNREINENGRRNGFSNLGGKERHLKRTYIVKNICMFQFGKPLSMYLIKNIWTWLRTNTRGERWCLIFYQQSKFWYALLLSSYWKRIRNLFQIGLLLVILLDYPKGFVLFKFLRALLACFELNCLQHVPNKISLSWLFF